MAKFQKGQSGNPGGRPKVLADIRALAQEHGPEAIKTLVAIAKNAKFAPAARVAASTALLDRGFGRPVQAVTGEDGEAIKVIAEVVWRESNGS